MISSTSNQKVKEISALLKKSRERKKQGLFVIEGIRMVKETPANLLKELFVSESFVEKSPEFLQGKTYEVLSDKVYSELSDTVTPQGILATVQMPGYKYEEVVRGEHGLYLVLETLQDPGNMGTIFRTAEGAGVRGIILNKTCVDLFSPKTVRSTMGSVYRVPFYVTEDLKETLEQMKKSGVSLYAAHLKAEKNYSGFSYKESTGFLIGNEGNGLTDEIAEAANHYIKIPMGGQLESLNASVAAGLLMYEAARQRDFKVDKF